MEFKKVKTDKGVWKLKMPKAGIRNEALVNAETETGTISQVRFAINLLPNCIAERPESFDKDVPITAVLDSLYPKTYDRLSSALLDWIAEFTLSEEKKTKSTTTQDQV